MGENTFIFAEGRKHIRKQMIGREEKRGGPFKEKRDDASYAKGGMSPLSRGGGGRNR